MPENIREVVLDTETTGLSPRDGHRIVEIGCVELLNHIPTGKHYHQYINPKRDMPDEAYRIHGLSSEFLSQKPVIEDVIEAFLLFIENSRLVIHNAEFDMRFINAELKKMGKKQLPIELSIDTVQLARNKFPGAAASLNALCQRFGVDNSARSFHGALLDAQLLAEVYLELIGGPQTNFDLTYNAQTGQASEATQSILTSRSKQPTTAESLAHKEFLKKINKPIWEI